MQRQPQNPETGTVPADFEALYRVINEMAPVPVVVHRDGIIALANAAAAALIGAESAEALKGLDLLPHIHEKTRDTALQRIRTARAEGCVLPPFEHLLMRLDGEVRCVEARSGPLSHLGPDLTISVFRDVTEERRAQAALDASERTLRSIFNSVHSAVFLHSPDGTILDVNDRMLELYGVSREEARGLTLAGDLSGPGNPATDMGELWRQVLAGSPRTFDWRCRRPRTGEVFDVEVHLCRVSLPTGGAVLATVTDITERKRAETALRDSESRFRALFENAGDGIALIRDSRFVACNPRIAELLGRPMNQVRQGTPGSFSPEFQPDGRRSEDKAVELMARATAGEQLLFEWRHLRADGQEFDVEVSLTRIDVTGTPLLQAVLRDVSERRRAEAALRESEARYRTLARNFPNGAVLLFDRDLRLILAEGMGLEEVGIASSDLVGKTPGECFSADLAVQMEDVFRQALAENTTLIEAPFADRTYEFRTVPVTGAEGHVTGGMAVTMDVSGRKRLEEQLRHQALHDPLTGLANRTLCLDRIRQAIERAKRRPGYNYAVLFVDLDRFKVVNDSMGHKFGDALLVETSSRLMDCVRDLDTVARLGGDEFVLLLEELESARRAIRVVRRVRRALAQDFSLGPRSMQLTASIGVVLDTQRYRSAEDVLQNANLAMHRAKEMGRDRFRVFTRRMLDAAVQRLNLESGLQQALSADQLFLVFQPIVRMGRTLSLYGFEALVRWRHPERGMVGPAEFIPVAEETGAIVEIGQWVLREACRTFVSWQGRLPGADRLALSVNVSARQFAQPDLVGSVRRALRDTGMSPDRLKLEITETTLMENASRAAERLKSLKDLGIRLSVDDFGTGYSNMITLQQLPLDLLKIDLSFVQKMDVNRENVEIVKAVISLAHSLGLEVVAEGVERPRHHEILSLLDCEYGQGYLYSPPLPAEEALAFIRDFRETPPA